MHTEQITLWLHCSKECPLTYVLSSTPFILIIIIIISIIILIVLGKIATDNEVGRISF